MVQGEELLIAEPVERDRKALRKLFDAEGYVCTAANDMAHACDVVQRKFFPVALVDLDFEGTNRGIELIQFIHERSAPTRIVLMAARRSFEAAVAALRTGVVDIVNKRPDQVEHLRSAVRLAVDRSQAGHKQGGLVREVRGVLDDALKIMLGLQRRLHPTDVNSAAGIDMKPAILIVDNDQPFLQQTANLLGGKPWEVSVELSGGSGLDRATMFGFQIVCVRDELDLPGQMVIRSCQAQKSATLALLYSQVGQGRIDRYEGGQVTHSDTPFRGPEHLVERMSSLVSEIASLREERRYLQLFRSEHGPFLKRFADLKARIDSLSE
ncbi:MAG TPA: response regulator [Polyangiales bacterium]|nr:response regulator [Polyangiales bacterium]